MSSPWIKVADLFPQSRHGRPPVLIGRIGPYKVVVVDRHDPALGEPKATLFVARGEEPGRRKTTSAVRGKVAAARALAAQLAEQR
jgi:hypothetical protein